MTLANVSRLRQQQQHHIRSLMPAKTRRSFRQGKIFMAENIDLFTPLNLRGLQLPNRILMSPMTRSRAGESDVQQDLNVVYYTQRSTAGLIITEGAQVSAEGKGYCRTPGIYTDAQVTGWHKITDSVHAEDGRIFLQLWHVGRISHPLNNDGVRAVAPSTIQATGQIFTVEEGMQDFAVPHALTTKEVEDVVKEHGHAAACAKAAGFDGVELHAGQGYLPMQFLSPNANQRDDKYGGSIANRVRFVTEALEAAVDVLGGKRVGIRIAPGFTFNDVLDDDPQETYTTLLQAIKPLNVAYIHVVTPPPPMSHNVPEDVTALVRDNHDGVLIRNGGYDQEKAEAALKSGDADLIAFGKLFLANPDLPARFKQGAELNAWDMETFYTPGPKGYTDYPALDG
jgi:N-ethylmaleimide reductase